MAIEHSKYEFIKLQNRYKFHPNSNTPVASATPHNMVRSIDQSETEPDVDLKPHCPQCHWHKVCTSVAMNEFDIDLLPRMSWETKDALKRAGIERLDHFMELSPERLREFKGIKTAAPKLLAQARALVEKRPVWLESAPAYHQQGGWMFDIETNPESQALWSIGWRDPQEQLGCIVVGRAGAEFATDDGIKISVVTSIQTAWDTFVEMVSGDSLPLYHWSPYDASRFRREASATSQTRIGTRMTDLARLVDNSVKLPILTGSLKGVAPYIGFEWSGYASFEEAWRDYQAWYYKHRQDRLLRALQYLCDDVRALSCVYQWWVSRAGDA